MRPLLEAIDTIGLTMLNDTIVVDKIVGKAAALLVSYFQAQEVHCGVLSAKAMELLNRQGIRYCYQKLIPIIMNKSGTDICPFEKVVMDIENPQEGYEQLSAQLKSFVK